MQAEDQQMNKINSHLRELQADALLAAAAEQEETFMDQINSLLRDLHSDDLVAATIENALRDTDLTEPAGIDLGASEHLLEALASDPFCLSLCEPA